MSSRLSSLPASLATAALQTLSAYATHGGGRPCARRRWYSLLLITEDLAVFPGLLVRKTTVENRELRDGASTCRQAHQRKRNALDSDKTLSNVPILKSYPSSNALLLIREDETRDGWVVDAAAAYVKPDIHYKPTNNYVNRKPHTPAGSSYLHQRGDVLVFLAVGAGEAHGQPEIDGADERAAQRQDAQNLLRVLDTQLGDSVLVITYDHADLEKASAAPGAGLAPFDPAGVSEQPSKPGTQPSTPPPIQHHPPHRRWTKKANLSHCKDAKLRETNGQQKSRE
ncbi:hypothetical protein QBC33DRAFT_520056 [Phialemonium atrogriseum]|uniref:Uncharacterized protein n=1 Tax=Phialemonium atrogriseum TaxID=1093897 RepID=A0AAJ0BP43_9PEZI|nr:uncharacterized protein QBC33DRAFT_520056 [Phialemonium atrogriseum]KAK1761885.1 hypothetical protein QBC33DRAFT_520056 [Phialemonium atrogriseum]